MFRHYLTLLLLFTCAFATTIQDRADAKDPPPSETSPSLPTRPGTVKNCIAWFPAKRGDTCDKIVHLFNISLPDFFKWNPDLDKNCEKNLWENYSYCVGVGKPPNPPALPLPAPKLPTSIPLRQQPRRPPPPPTLRVQSLVVPPLLPHRFHLAHQRLVHLVLLVS